MSILMEYLRKLHVIENEILLPDFTSCCGLSENPSWPQVRTQNDIFIFLKQQALLYQNKIYLYYGSSS